MEAIKNVKKHEISITNRASGKISGIQKVVSSCETSLVLISECGNIFINGEKLRIIRYNSDSGELEFDGSVNGIKYGTVQKGLLKRIFK